MTTEFSRKKIQRRRGVSLALRLIRIQFLLMQYLLAPVAIRKAFKLWFATRRFASPAREQRWGENAKLQRIPTSVGQIQTYRWGSGPLIFLVHGWNGRGLQLAAFVEPLLARGYQVLSLDLPGHGLSEGNSTNIFRISQVLNELQQQFDSPHAIIAHSFGVTAVSYALNHGLHANRFVAISAPLNTEWLFDRFSSAIRLKSTIVKRLRGYVEKQFGANAFNEISTDYNFAKLSLPTLVIHDRDDSDVPWQHGETLANTLNGAELYLTNGLGHRRILFNRKVLALVADFVAAKYQQVKTAGRN